MTNPTPHTSYTIRDFANDDIDQLIFIEEATQSAPWSVEAFQRCRDAHYPGWVIDQDGKVLGFIIVSLGASECHILNVCVDPLFQGKKLGRTLLNTALSHAKQRGADMVYLEVRRSNHVAIHLYHSLHFNEIGVRKGYYPDPKGAEDALVFARDISMDDALDFES